MNRFQKLFSDKNKKVFVPFFMLGDPSVEFSFLCIQAALESGAHALELGIPFSDPVADGPVIETASRKAVAAGVDFQQCLALIKRIREISDVPIGLLVYYNLLFRQTQTTLYERLKKAGVDGVLVVDLPMEESQSHERALAQQDIGCIQLIAPNTPLERAQVLLEKSTAFSYVISRYGATGVSNEIAGGSYDRIAQLRLLSDAPLVVGFGISRPEQVKRMHKNGANGAIIGSAIVKIIAENTVNIAQEKIKQLVCSCVI